MENYSYSSYPDSRDSSPRSREIDCENQSWDEHISNSNYKVKFMCSYGGKIHPRPHDNQLTYIAGDTKILAVDRNVKLLAILSKLSTLSDIADVCFKYQLPGEDLDALISVTNDEDLEHMMLEYDRLYRASAKPARLRLFLFPLNHNPSPTSFGSNEAKSERQWFVDALNSVQIQGLEASSPPAVAAVSAANPDFLFGFDKGFPPAKLQESAPSPTAPEVGLKDVTAGSDCGSEDRNVVGEAVVSPSDIQRQIQDMQRMQISGQEQAIMQRKIDEGNNRAFPGEYYAQKVQEKIVPSPAHVQAQMPMQTSYMSERHMTTTGFPVATSAATEQQQLYFFPTQAGVYQPPTLRPVTGQVGQGYYQVQRMATDMYREQQMYNAVPQTQMQQPKVGGYSDGIGMLQQKVAVQEPAYTQVGYDGAGRQVYYATPTQVGVVSQYQTTVSTDSRQSGGGTSNNDGKVAKAPQAWG